ncbi:hypothetical protein GQ600_16236 [Phytophthora cactorum]|nr:hypothetical protein GQ600_16236 [Phytophthora cactorum]
MLWFWIFCWFFTIAECVAKLLPETFTSTPTPTTLSATRITVKLVRAMFAHIVLVTIMSVGVGFVIASHHLAHDKLKADVVAVSRQQGHDIGRVCSACSSQNGVETSNWTLDEASSAQALAKYPLPRVGVHPQDGVVKILRVQSLLTTTASLSSPELEGIARVQKVTALHAAEVYADMHGEYIAMCCAYVIIICFGSNPRFSLGGNASSSSTHEIQFSTVMVQIGIEVVVDIIAIPLEIRFGVDFDRFHKDDAFLAIFMVLVAVVNTHIASGVYMKTE